MSPAFLPPALVDFLAKSPSVLSRRFTIGSLDGTYELVASRELDSYVGVLRLTGVVLSELEQAERLCGVKEGRLEDLTDEQRRIVEASGLGETARVLVFEGPGHQRYIHIGTDLDFSLRSWLDKSFTERALRKNAELGYPSRRALQSQAAESEEELEGHEIVCLYCLQPFRFGRVTPRCPSCGADVWPLGPRSLPAMFFSFGRDLYAKSGCLPLTQRTDVTECYRLIKTSSCMNHWIVEVGRGETSASLLAKAWDYKLEEWETVADRRLLPEEWHRFITLVRLAAFWDLPPEGGNPFFGGHRVVLEGIRDSVYYFVSRWNPMPEMNEENFAHPCEYLLELVGANRPDRAWRRT